MARKNKAKKENGFYVINISEVKSNYTILTEQLVVSFVRKRIIYRSLLVLGFVIAIVITGLWWRISYLSIFFGVILCILGWYLEGRHLFGSSIYIVINREGISHKQQIYKWDIISNIFLLKDDVNEVGDYLRIHLNNGEVIEIGFNNEIIDKSLEEIAVYINGFKLSNI